PKEAERMDPQQRLFLRSCWEVLEDAGYASREKISRKKVGVYVGVMNHDYSEVLSKSGLNHDAHEMMGNSGSILAARISYILDLKGPSMTVDTACSSSLVASHLAIQSILSGECEMAIAGGVTLYLDERLYILMSKSGMLTPNGLCKTFDNDADGFVPGEGCGAVLLKSLDKALADGDHIHAVIKGSGLNQDGKTNGITAPSALSQTELELGIYQKYEINPETITMMEAHGTATKLGDPIEVNALTDSWRKYTPKKQFCAIGSVKSNLGHTSAAAGMAGLFKIILAMKKGKIPPTLHFKKGNEHIDFQNSPFFVVDKLLEWKTPAGIPKRAALNSFGFSGTNAHFVIEEGPKVPRTARREAPFYLAMITGRKAGNIEGMLKKVLAFLELPENAQLHPGDISMTINSGRQLFQRKAALIYTSVNDLKRQIRDLLAKAPLSETTPGPLLNLKGSTKRDPAFKF
ncbi:MAG: hypothetical protein JNM63_04420, partial [Spirochaetia bacterium]|nr:hypothetical protein [Spirochaetia bacterium]